MQIVVVSMLSLYRHRYSYPHYANNTHAMLVLSVEVLDRMLADGTFSKLLHTLRLDLSSSNTRTVRASSSCMLSSIIIISATAAVAAAVVASIRDCSDGTCGITVLSSACWSRPLC